MVVRRRVVGVTLAPVRQPAGKLTLGVEPPSLFGRLRFRAREFLWGLFLFESWKELGAERRRYEDALNVLIFGELLGLPLMNSTLTLRLLPFVVPDLKAWRERQLAEREVLDHPPDVD